MSRTRRGFTLLEVMGSVLVLSLGLASAIGMVLYGLHLAKLSMGKATALATAMTVAVDPSPLQSGWTATVPGTTKGFLNGYYVERTEGLPTIIAGGITTADIRVDVYETLKGRPVASFNQLLVKR